MRQWIIAAVGCVTLAGGGWYFLQNSCSEKSAYEAVKMEMAQYLTAPSTAIYQPWDRVATNAVPNSCVFSLSGYLESQNGFGAMVKTTFRAHVLKSQSGDYAPLILDVNGRLPGI